MPLGVGAFPGAPIYEFKSAKFLMFCPFFVATALHQNQERKRADVIEEEEVRSSAWELMDFGLSDQTADGVFCFRGKNRTGNPNHS